MNSAENLKKPFYEIALSEINEENINEIKNLEEGWFIEFKSSFTDTSKIAKSISSFANAYGGIIIIGVQEAQKGRKFEKFCPLSEDEAEATILRLRNAAESYLQPCPFFEAKKINIPDLQDLEEKKSIIIVKIPRSDRAPHLHSSGAIYTRKGDSSSPTPLTDQGLLERLWSDRAQKEKDLENRIKFLHEQSSSKIPRIDIFITKTADANPRDPDEHLNFEEFLGIASQRHLPSASPIFNNFYPLDRSYVARRIETSPDATGIMWEYDWDRSIHHIQIPFPCHEWDGEKFREDISGNERVKLLEDFLLFRNEFSNKKTLVIDTTPILLFMSILFFMIFRVRERDKRDHELRINMKTSSIRSAAIFTSLPEYKNHIEDLGIPIMHRDIGFFSESMNPDKWLKFEPLDKTPGDQGNIFLEVSNSLMAFARLLQMLGVSTKLIFGHSNLSHPDANEKELIELFKKVTSTNLSYSSIPNPSEL